MLREKKDRIYYRVLYFSTTSYPKISKGFIYNCLQSNYLQSSYLKNHNGQAKIEFDFVLQTVKFEKKLKSKMFKPKVPKARILQSPLILPK